MKKLTFINYYKYTFYFKDEEGVTWFCGGDADDIYRLDVEPENVAVDKWKNNTEWYLGHLRLTKLVPPNKS